MLTSCCMITSIDWSCSLEISDLNEAGSLFAEETQLGSSSSRCTPMLMLSEAPSPRQSSSNLNCYKKFLNILFQKNYLDNFCAKCLPRILFSLVKSFHLSTAHEARSFEVLRFSGVLFDVNLQIWAKYGELLNSSEFF